MKRRFFWLLPVFVALFIWACSSDADDTEDPSDDDVSMTDDDRGNVSDDDGSSVTFDRGTMLANWADTIILPSYDSFLTVFASLKLEFDTFQGDANEANLVNLRAAWIEELATYFYV